jgi:poly-beta-1,6-N-acetyl-D-glucosamine synthase
VTALILAPAGQELGVQVLYWTLVACFAHLMIVNVIFLGLLAVASVENFTRRREHRAEDYPSILGSRFTIPVSVICPVYNEESIVGHVVRSLLLAEYPEFEVIVVNDGSADGTLDLLKREFDLERREVFFRRALDTEAVRGVYRSRRDPRLVVVDKENGGKADALNCGLNLARYRYVCTVDGDTVFHPRALLRAMRVALRDPGAVVGVTSRVSISHEPENEETEADGGRIADRGLLSSFQHLDYLRAFVNNRVAWSRLGFMLCSVGAFSLWRRDVVMELGGFSRDFTCEDIEMTFRVHEHHLRLGLPYKVVSLPDSVGHTEGPDQLRQLMSQRARWQRVILETVWHYRRMFLNPRYRRVGALGMPFYVLTEVLAPVFELLSVLTVPAAVLLGVFGPREFLLFLGFVAFSNAVFTTAAVMMQDLGAREYRWRDLLRLTLLGPVELFVYRPPLSIARLMGSWGFLRGDKTWHKFDRNTRAATDPA